MSVAIKTTKQVILWKTSQFISNKTFLQFMCLDMGNVPGVDSVSNRNEYQVYLLGVKVAGSGRGLRGQDGVGSG